MVTGGETIAAGGVQAGSAQRIGDRQGSSAWRDERAAVALVFLVAAALFLPGLPAPFLFDDFADVVDNAAAQPATFLGELPGTVRPLLKASYAANAWAHGPWAPGYRAVNLALHLVATILVWRLMRRTLAGEGAVGRRAAVLAAAVWAFHPLAVESVTRVSGRSAALSGVLALAACLLATSTRPAGTAQAMAVGLAALLAPLARETALVLPAALLLWQLTLAPRERARAVMTRHVPVWIGTGMAATVIAMLPRHRELASFGLRASAPLDTLRTNVFAIPEMLSLLVRPWAVSIDPAGPVVTPWLSSPTALRVVALLVAAAAVAVLRRRSPVAAFAVGWTLLWLLPSNSVILRLDPVGVRPLYLASLGPALCVGLGAARLARLGRRPARLVTVAAGTILVALAGMTAAASRRACDPVAEWRHAVRLAPCRARPHVGLGMEYLRAGRLAEAELELSTALDLAPWLVTARCALEGVRIDRAVRGRAPHGGDG